MIRPIAEQAKGPLWTFAIASLWIAPTKEVSTKRIAATPRVPPSAGPAIALYLLASPSPTISSIAFVIANAFVLLRCNPGLVTATPMRATLSAKPASYRFGASRQRYVTPH